MGTFQERTEDYVGSIADTTALADWFTAGAKRLIDLIPPEKLERFSTTLSDAGSGVDVSAHRFIRAHKAGRGAVSIDAGLKTQAADSTSIFYGTATSPVCYLEATKAYILPGGGSVMAVSYPTVAYSASSISNFPTEWEQGVILFAAIQAAIGLMNTSITTLSGLSLGAISTTPSAPTDATYSYSNASLGTYSATTIGSLGTAPTYTKPTISMTTAPSDFSFSIGLTAPTPPSAPSFTYTDATLGTYTSTVVGDLGTAPTYTKPTVTLPATPSAFSLGVGVVAPTAPNAPVFSYTNASGGTYTTTTIGTLPTVPTYTKPTTTFSLTNALTYIETDEDLDKGMAELSAQNSLLDQYGKDLYNELNELNASLEEYKAGVQKLIHQADLDQQRILQTASDTKDLNLQNELQTLNAAISDYKLQLDLYLGQINSYQAQVNSAVTIYVQGTLGLYQANCNVLLSQYQTDIQNEINEFQKDLSIYQSTVQKAITDAQLAQDRILKTANDTKDLSLQNEAQTLAQQIQEYQSSLGKFGEEISLYAQNVNKEIAAYKTNLEKWQTQRQTELAEYNSSIQNEINEFQKENAEYITTVQKAIRQAELDQERLILSASKTTDLNLQNAAQTLNAAIELYKTKMEKYLGQINQYGAEVNKVVNEYQIKVQQAQTVTDKYQMLVTQLQNEYKAFLETIR